MRADEEALQSDLDVAGLKAQVLGRIEELEARVYDAGAVKPMLGG